MSKIAFIYPGQGAQKCGMGADFYENSASVRKLFDEAGEQLGLDMKALCFEENDLLDQMPCHDRSSDGTWSKTRYYSGTEPWRIRSHLCGRRAGAD